MDQMKTERKPYITPSIETVSIALEEGIATSSSTVNIGGPSQSDGPYVEDWKEQSSIHDLTF